MVRHFWLQLLLRASLLVFIKCEDDDDALHEIDLVGNLPRVCGNRPKLAYDDDVSTKEKIQCIPHDWPFHGGLYTTLTGKSPICGATLIAPNWVLTATHCIVPLFKCKDPPPAGKLFSVEDKTGHAIVIHLGDHDYKNDTGVEEHHLVDKAIFYPGSLAGILEHDIALLRLETKVKRKTHISFACLPPKAYQPPAFSFCYFVGWGRIFHRAFPDILKQTNFLMEGKVRVAGTTSCLRHTRGNGRTNHICTDEVYAMTCRGDSGGGLHCLDPQGRWIVSGIVSAAPKNCTQGLRIYTNTRLYLNWIKEIIRKN